MLNSSTVFGVTREAYRLLAICDVKGRKLRRFLGQVAPRGLVIQQFAFQEGHTPLQLVELTGYAEYLRDEQTDCLPKGSVVCKGTVFDEGFSLVANHYKLEQDVATASVADLLKMVKAVAVLSDCLHPFAASPNEAALHAYPDYVYRGYPCNVVPDDALWCVSGEDVRGQSGVLEWCVDASDAALMLAEMKRFPERFINVQASLWSGCNQESSTSQACLV